MNTIQIKPDVIQQKLNTLLKLSDWYPALNSFTTSNDFITIIEKLIEEKDKGYRFVPKLKDVFNPFIKCKLDNLKVIIIGQDPYPTLHSKDDETIADGLAFSCSYSKKEQPSLTKIFDAIQDTVKMNGEYERNPDLSRWAEQGVLLLNTGLTTQLHKPGTHYEIWSDFISFVLDYIYWNKPDVVFILMGKVAHTWEDFINDSNSFTILTEHPAAACYKKTDWDSKNCFNRANKFLVDHNKEPIIW
jgi:uracil-DNA glycosylase